MYKIYINEKLLEVRSTNSIKLSEIKKSSVSLYNCDKDEENLLKAIKQCEKNGTTKKVIIHAQDLDELFHKFSKHYTIIEAAGGLVKNEYNEFLFIFRRGHWDLPKGKFEKNETSEQAAIREVIEETSIKSVDIDEKIGVTYHTFVNKSKKKILKKSHWFLMQGLHQKLKPQEEEDITIAKWLSLSEFKQLDPVYKNIKHIVKVYKSKFDNNP